MDNTNGFTKRTPKYFNSGHGDHDTLHTTYDRHEPLAKRGDPHILGTIALVKGDMQCGQLDIL